MKETAFSKVNLALHIRRRLENGYHELETVFAFVNKGDEITVSENRAGAGMSLIITGRFAESLSDTGNLVLDAAKLLAEYSDRSADIVLTLDKQLPVASGIGGGSADAAATLRLLNRYWGLDIPLQELAQISRPLGADVPACVYSQTSSGEGIGQDLKLTPDNKLSGANILLVNPLKTLSTAEVFAGWDGEDRGGLDICDAKNALAHGRNDLKRPAAAIIPEITDILAALKSTDPVAAKMSGSGATCFAIYRSTDKADAVEKRFQSQYPDFWTLRGVLR